MSWSKSGRRSSVPAQRARAGNTDYNPHLGDRTFGTEYKPKYMHQDIDRILDDLDQRPGTSASRPYATVVVAAYDSQAAGHAAADFICTGTDDHLVVQEALDYIGDTFNGGEVLLLEGSYTFTDGVTLPAAGTRLRGVGRGTQVDYTGVAGDDFAVTVPWANGSVSNLALQGPGSAGSLVAIVCGGEYSSIDEVYIYSFPVGVKLDGSLWSRVSRSFIDGNGSAISATSAEHGVISDNHILNGSAGIILASCSDVAVVGNSARALDSFVESTTSTGCAVTGNVVTTTTAPIVLSGNGSPMGGNALVVSNYIYDSQEHSIKVTDSDDNTIVGNGIHGFTGLVTDTYDGIFLDGTSSQNNVQANTIRKGGGVRQLRYGINVSASTCSANLVTNNDLLNAGAVGTLNDAGTGTVTTAGNRT